MFPGGVSPVDMRSNWKKALLWSSLGGVAIGTAASMVRNRRRAPASKPRCTKIPDGVARIHLQTERYQVEESGNAWTLHDRYLLQATPFKAWSVLELPETSNVSGEGGSDIYHVTHSQFRDAAEPESAPGEECVLDRFYGTVTALGADGKSCGSNTLARGATLEIAKCLVGGASNGVETGELHRSAAPILNFRFELEPRSNPEA